MEEEDDGREGRKVPEQEPMGTETLNIFASALRVGRDRLVNTPLLMALNGVIAGLYVAFSGLGAITLYALALPSLGEDAAWALAALLYPVGFLFVIVGKSELFTENFLTPVLAAWEDRDHTGGVLRLWVITLVTNLIGVALMALVWSQPALGLLEPATRAAFAHVAERELGHSYVSILAKGVFAGMLVNFMSWLVVAGRGHVVKVLFVIIPTYLVMFLELSHSIVASFEILTGAIVLGAGFDAYLIRWLPMAVLGNMLGGILFVAVVHYAQVRAESKKLEEREEEEEEARRGERRGQPSR